MKVTNYIASAALAATLGLWGASAANALVAACSPNNNAVFYLETSSVTACETGNDTNTIDADYELFGKTGWLLQDKTGENLTGSPEFTKFEENALSPSIFKTFGAITYEFKSGGAWELGNATPKPQHIAITLKDANGFAAFLLSSSVLPQAGTWGTTKELENGQAISHASVYTVGVVPLPAGIWMIAAAFGGLGVAARYKKKLTAA